MKYLGTIVFFLFLSILELMAQSDFRNAYIITNENDTVYGLIDYKGNIANSKKCIFRADVDSELQLFTPNEIKAFRFVDSKYYCSKAVLSGLDTKQLFLEYLINGIVDIYYYRDEKGEHYLVEDDTGDLSELKNEEKEIIIDNVLYIKESKEYIGLLKAAFSESPAISHKIDNININHKSLINIARDYHNEICSNEECIVYEKKLPKIKSTYGLIIGLNSLLISDVGEFFDELYYMKNIQTEFNIFPSIGLYSNVNMPFVNEKLYFQYELTYSRMTLNTSSSFIEPVYVMSYLIDMSLAQNLLNNVALLKYEYSKGKIRPVFQFGVFLTYFFETDYSRNVEVKYSWGGTYNSYQTNGNPFRKLDLGLNFGLGFKSIFIANKEMFVDFRYQRGFGLLRELNTNTYSVNIGFQFIQ